MKNLYILLITLTSLTLFSCEKMMFEEEVKTDSAKENFEYLWKQADEKYTFFSYKNIDWNQMHDKYAAQIYEGMSEEALFTVMGNMLTELKDGHVNLMSHFNISHYDFNTRGPSNIDMRVVTDNYLPANYYISGPFAHDFIVSGKDGGKNNEIGYIRFKEFTGTVTQDNMDFIVNRYKNTKGLIFDIRQNGGGVSNDIFNILEHFVNAEATLFKAYTKIGKGHEDFNEGELAKVSPGGEYYSKRIMVLTDRGTFSSGSFFSLATKALPNMTLVGDTTGGGLGLPNGGQLPNGWNYRFSITKTLDLNGNNYEYGVPCDIFVRIDPASTTDDAVIDRAISELQ